MITAQNEPCGYGTAIEKMEHQYPGYKDAVRKTFKEVKRNMESTTRGPETVYTIPVVIHIVWKEAEENISDELIASQIAVLNEDFRRQNPDADEVRAEFTDVVGDAKINFEVVEVIRVKTDTEFSFAIDIATLERYEHVKSSETGGSDAKDTKRNLNIWICKLQPDFVDGEIAGQLYGYAYPPAGLEHWPSVIDFGAPSPELDGVVLDYRTVGRDSPFTFDPGNGTDLQLHGRTATHEVGHFLGLMHIWGGDNIILGGQNCDHDDGMPDTPNADRSDSTACDHMRNTCSDPNDKLDMVENYMGYTEDQCKNSFTLDQIAMMRGVLEGPRCGLIGCNEESSQGPEFDIYPNPANTFINISSKDPDVIINSVGIFSNLGKLVFKIESLNNNEIDVKDLVAGYYQINIETSEGKSSKPFVKVD